MLRLLCPDIYLDSIYELDLNKLKIKGIKGIITDLDNTLIPWGESTVMPELEEWFRYLKENDFKVCIVSNNSLGRVKVFADTLDIPAIPKAVKPRRGAFRLALSKMGITLDEAAVLGDQIFTDVLGGNRLGLFTVLVIPVSEREFIGTQVVRKVERYILKRLKCKGMLRY
ncbi:YqeG family HAD IIIA-type phosphatase [Candidatus Contubernalis alkaliaceticus]|uniref:YqeG family HAD IIIA-type phosphatase n=1 Tax=Candidatus Contubernalis alkaliaceticus TaxID=338645 RepID=UPI001F4C17F3|nr:YqeG family HAD IIIA-type phosphatase [Candidatus Contubernalis alkalaceticus]UNC92577.1 YqeG family HAD IIIA-type phosphatase [Candidatus Contubernalis alkalaceticus]